jgi:hypothetical protein
MVTLCRQECGGWCPLPVYTVDESLLLDMRALERLKAAVSMKATRKAVTLPDGSEFEFYSKPVTLAQRTKAQRMANSDVASDFALQLLVMLAEDENGQRMFAPGDVAELRNELPANLVESLMLMLAQEVMPDEEEADPKPSSSSSKKTTS